MLARFGDRPRTDALRENACLRALESFPSETSSPSVVSAAIAVVQYHQVLRTPGALLHFNERRKRQACTREFGVDARARLRARRVLVVAGNPKVVAGAG